MKNKATGCVLIQGVVVHGCQFMRPTKPQKRRLHLSFLHSRRYSLCRQQTQQRKMKIKFLGVLLRQSLEIHRGPNIFFKVYV